MTRTKRCKKRCEQGALPELRVHYPLAVLFALTFLLALDGSGLLRISLLCALLHEMGHLAAYYLVLHRAPVVVVSPTGLCMRMRGVLLSPVRELWLAAAGPLANLAFSLAALLVMQLPGCASYNGYWFACVNLWVGAGNLLPLPGLDGARMLRCLASLVHRLHFRRG